MKGMNNQREVGDLQERLAGAISYAKVTAGLDWPDVAAGYVLQMLGLDDLDAAVERVARCLSFLDDRDVEFDQWPERVLTAALTPPGEQSGV